MPDETGSGREGAVPWKGRREPAGSQSARTGAQEEKATEEGCPLLPGHVSCERGLAEELTLSRVEDSEVSDLYPRQGWWGTGKRVETLQVGRSLACASR